MKTKRFLVAILLCIVAISIVFVGCDDAKEISYSQLLDKLRAEDDEGVEEYDEVVIYVDGYDWKASFTYPNDKTEIFNITGAPSIYDYNSYSLFMTELQSIGVSLSKIKMELADPNN